MEEKDFDISDSVSLSNDDLEFAQSTAQTQSSFAGAKPSSNLEGIYSIKSNLEAISIENLLNILSESRELKTVRKAQQKDKSNEAYYIEENNKALRKIQEVENQLLANESQKLTLEQKLSQGEEQRSKSKELLENLERKNRRLENDNAGLKHLLQRMNLEKDDLNSQIAHAALERDQAVRECKVAKEKLAIKEAENEELLQRIGNLEKANEQVGGTLNNLGLAEYSQKLMSLTSTVDGFSQMEQEFSLEKTQIYDFLNLILEEYKEKTKALQDLQDSKLKETVTKFQSENITFKQRIDTLETIIKKHETKTSQLLTQIEALKAENHALNMKLADTKSDSQKIQSLQEELKRKSTLISGLQALVKIIEANNTAGGRNKIQDLDVGNESHDQRYNQLLAQNSSLTEELIRTKNVYEALKSTINGLEEKDNEKILERMAQLNSELKEQNMKLSAESKKIYEDALEKIGALKKIARELLGWEISINQEVIELKNPTDWAPGKESTVAIRITEETNTQEIVETEFTKEMFNKNQNLIQLALSSYPVLFSYLNILLRPDLSNLENKYDL